MHYKIHYLSIGQHATIRNYVQRFIANYKITRNDVSNECDWQASVKAL